MLGNMFESMIKPVIDKFVPQLLPHIEALVVEFRNMNEKLNAQTQVIIDQQKAIDRNTDELRKLKERV